MTTWLPYLWGALGGAGILCVWHGFRRVADRERPQAERRRGLWLLNGGVLLLAASLFLALRVNG